MFTYMSSRRVVPHPRVELSLVQGPPALREFYAQWKADILAERTQPHKVRQGGGHTVTSPDGYWLIAWEINGSAVLVRYADAMPGTT